MKLSNSPTVALPLGAFLLIAPTAHAIQTVVQTGDDLAAIVAAAADGDEIRIDSDATFTGTLAWEGKSLTLRAGAGFAPIVLGDPGEPALNLTSFSAGATGCTAEGVTFGPSDEPGASSSSVLTAGPVVGSSNSLTGEFVDCSFDGQALLTCSGENTVDLEFRACSFEETVTVGAFLESQFDADFREGCEFDECIVSFPSGATGTLQFADASFTGMLGIVSASTSSLTANVRRCRLGGGLVAGGLNGSGPLVVVESTLIAPGSSAQATTGVELASGGLTQLVNCTVAGWELGILSPGGFIGENLAVFDNAVDTDLSGFPSLLTSSLVADGSATGLTIENGQPLWNEDYSLAPGSLGIDLGNNGALELGPLDLQGNPRIQDGDEDGISRVDVGAFELEAACSPASLELVNGGGTNPLGYTPQGPPTLGSTFQANIQVGAPTVLTILAVNPLSATPLQIPGVKGEVLLQIDAALVLDYGVALGQHQLSIPDDSELCGLSVGSQGLRVDFDPLSGAVETLALNGYRLTLGQ